MPAAAAIAGLAARPGPGTDRHSAAMPARIAEVLPVVQILADYGRHLLDTMEHRALWRGFATIAQFFGTAAVPVMLAHIQRGIMRAVALERVLRARAARGRDLVPRPPPGYCWRTVSGEDPPEEPSEQAAAPMAGAQPASSTADAGPAAAEFASAASAAASADAASAASAAASSAASAAASSPPATPVAPTRQPRRPGIPDALLTLDNLPSMARLMIEVRHRPIGRTLVEICRDLGVAPILCTGPFWDRLLAAIQFYRGSLGNVMLEMLRREKRFAKEQWQHPNAGLPAETLDGVRRVLGFLIGERPVDPHRAAPSSGEGQAAASGTDASVPARSPDVALPAMTFIAPIGTGPP
ncbi:MAG TPA: hypothetical protein VMB34_10030 [Acetobacteraceae bacterium]|nr:hypothetical protein [Acetobacteraceae bacterium]